MFQFPGFPSYTYLIQYRIHGSSPWGFPHSEIHGSMLIYSSPWLIAVSHVLLRLLMPRHSPYALCNLNLLFSYLRWVSQYLFTDLVACFLPPFGGKIAVSYLFSWKDQFLSFSIAFSISVRLLYSVFNDHLHSLNLALVLSAMFHVFACETKSFRLRMKLADKAPPCRVVGLDGFEPSTSRLSGARSNHLSYRPWWRWWDSNPWPPACRAGALPTELHPHGIYVLWVLISPWKLNNNLLFLYRTPLSFGFSTNPNSTRHPWDISRSP